MAAPMGKGGQGSGSKKPHLLPDLVRPAKGLRRVVCPEPAGSDSPMPSPSGPVGHFVVEPVKQRRLPVLEMVPVQAAARKQQVRRKFLMRPERKLAPLHPAPELQKERRMEPEWRRALSEMGRGMRQLGELKRRRRFLFSSRERGLPRVRRNQKQSGSSSRPVRPGSRLRESQRGVKGKRKQAEQKSCRTAGRKMRALCGADSFAGTVRRPVQNGG